MSLPVSAVFTHRAGLRYYAFPSLAGVPIVHAIYTRHGGVSPQPWEGLNVGGTVGDDPARVRENRRRAFEAAGRPVASLFDVWQVHGREVVTAERPRRPDEPHARADAILTDTPGVTLFMRFADCVPILLVDPVRRAVGLVHAGWQGTVQRVAQAAVEAMAAQFGSRPADLLAGIGPSIGAHHYPVGPEVVSAVQAAFGPEAPSLLAEPDGGARNGVQFDLWAANRLVLEQAGLGQIEVAGICTACSLEDWFSHRGEKGCTGRFGALIALA